MLLVASGTEVIRYIILSGGKSSRELWLRDFKAVTQCSKLQIETSFELAC